MVVPQAFRLLNIATAAELTAAEARKLAAALLDALGLPADTTDVDLVVATVTDLAAQVAGMDPTKPSTVAPPQPSATASR